MLWHWWPRWDAPAQGWQSHSRLPPLVPRLLGGSQPAACSPSFPGSAPNPMPWLLPRFGVPWEKPGLLSASRQDPGTLCTSPRLQGPAARLPFPLGFFPKRGSAAEHPSCCLGEAAGGEYRAPGRKKGASLLRACPRGYLAPGAGCNATSIAFICLHADECPSTTLRSKKPKLSPPGRRNGKTTETFSFQLPFAWS